METILVVKNRSSLTKFWSALSLSVILDGSCSWSCNWLRKNSKVYSNRLVLSMKGISTCGSPCLSLVSEVACFENAMNWVNTLDSFDCMSILYHSSTAALRLSSLKSLNLPGLLRKSNFLASRTRSAAFCSLCHLAARSMNLSPLYDEGCDRRRLLLRLSAIIKIKINGYN